MREAAAEYDRLIENAEVMGLLRFELQQLRERIVALEPRNVDEYRSLLAQLREGR